MIRRPPRSTRTDTSFPTRRSSDLIGYVGLPFGSDNPDHGLLCVNHEYTSPEVMFPGAEDASTEAGVAIEMAAHGGSIVEVRRENGRWSVVRDGQYNRRITAGGTYMELTGPAAGHNRLKTSADASGSRCIGTLNRSDEHTSELQSLMRNS